jgi:hypothetical protein
VEFPALPAPLLASDALRPPQEGGGGVPAVGGGALMPQGEQEMVENSAPSEGAMEEEENEENWWISMDRRVQLAVGEMDDTREVVRGLRRSMREALGRVDIDVQILQRSLLGEEGLDGEVIVVREVPPRELSLQVRSRLEELRKAQEVANRTLSEKIQGMNALEGRVQTLEQRTPGGGGCRPGGGGHAAGAHGPFGAQNGRAGRRT